MFFPMPFRSITIHDSFWSAFPDRKPPGVGRGRGRGRDDGPGRQAKGIGRGLDEGGAKGTGGGRGRGGQGGKAGGTRGNNFAASLSHVINIVIGNVVF